MTRRSRIGLISIVFALIIGLAIGNYLSEVKYREERERVKIELAEKDRKIEELSELVSVLQVWLEGNMTFYGEKIALLEEHISELEKQLKIRVLGIYFSPKGGCASAIINWIKRANSSIYILIYSFTLDSIGEALIEAYNRGVDVKAVFEKGQITQYSEYWRLRDAGIPVRNDTNPKSMHHKVMIIDGEIIITGSYNWSKTAEEENNENLIIIKDRDIARKYEEEFEKIWIESI
ncbi:MAG: phospholipase D family protein [Candidatus Bathyarchaeota archaeon]|nr:phospholipase D family protein [Candidatus Bathyarchaeota archaeon]